MTKKTSASVTPKGRSNITPEEKISPPQSENMIRKAAYFRYVQRGSALGHDLDDWLAAEAELFKRQAEQQQPELVEMTELNMQESGVHGAWTDDALKRIIRQHPQKGIPQVESIEPQEAPPKE